MPVDQRPLTKRWFSFLLDAASDNATTITQRVLDAVPIRVKRALGQQHITADNLASLPRVGLDTTQVGAYLSTATESSKAAAARSKAAGKHQYVGSACSKRGGLVQRMKSHFQTIQRIRRGKGKDRITRHYRLATRLDVKSEFFVLAKFPPTSPEPQETAFFTEGVLQVFLNVVIPSTRASHVHNPAVTTFIDSSRAAVPDLPDFSRTTGPEGRLRR